jgi:BASS family bile acid:Na+ symporter
MEHSVFATIVLPIALAVIMVSLGMNLTTADFRRVAVYPKGMAIGLANLLILSPLLAFAVAEGLASGDTALMHGRNAAAPALA